MEIANVIFLPLSCDGIISSSLSIIDLCIKEELEAYLNNHLTIVGKPRYLGTAQNPNFKDSEIILLNKDKATDSWLSNSLNSSDNKHLGDMFNEYPCIDKTSKIFAKVVNILSEIIDSTIYSMIGDNRFTHRSFAEYLNIPYIHTNYASLTNSTDYQSIIS